MRIKEKRKREDSRDLVNGIDRLKNRKRQAETDRGQGYIG